MSILDDVMGEHGVAVPKAAYEKLQQHIAARQPVGISAEWVLGYLTTDAPEDSREAIRNAFTEYAALSGARQPVEMIAKKVGDYRVTVADDAITVSHGRDIVFAYSAGDPEPINASQPVSVSVDTLRALADRWAYDREYTGSPVDDIRALIDAPTSARQPVGYI